MRRFLVSLLAAGALIGSFATVASANNGDFPEGVPPAGNAQVCTVIPTTPAFTTGSSTGFANKADLFIDACLGGP
jgi:hypothetical protein